jgi:hypothetical protein
MSYFPNVADSFSRGMQAGAALGAAIREGRESEERMKRQKEMDARADALLQIQNPGLEISSRVEATKDRPAAITAGVVAPGTEGDVVENLGPGYNINVSKRDRVDDAIAARENKQRMALFEAEHRMRKKFEGNKYDPTSGMQIITNEDGSVSYAPVLPQGSQGDPMKGTFDRETERRKGESDAQFEQRKLLDQAERDFKAIENAKDRDTTRSLADIKAAKTPIKMSQSDEKMVETLSTQNAKKISIANQIEQAFNTLSDPKTDEKTKVTIGKQVLKTLNSTEGADAVGVEESKRLGALLEYNFFNPKAAISGEGALVGRDLEGFKNQVGESMKNVRGAVSANEKIIREIESKYGVSTSGGGEGRGEKLSREMAADILKQAKGNKEDARSLAKKLGYSF